MIVHLVTDRRRLAAGCAGPEARQCLLRQIEYAITAGIDVVQIRERDLDARELAALVREAVARASGTPTRIVVNDRADVALACGADGVHLRSDSVPPSVVRAIAPEGFLIGRSVHTVVEARDACAGVDYLLAGTVWPTESKERGSLALLGIDGFAAVAAAVDVPVLAIGGVAVARVRELLDAGAAGIAGIGLFLDATRQGCRSVQLTDTMTVLQKMF